MSGLLSRVVLAFVVGLTAVVGGSVAADAAPALVVVSPGATTGTAIPGSYVSVDLGTWQDPGPDTYSFQWLRDGAPIAGATTRDYLLAAADVGHRLEPVVTGSRPGYQSASFTGAAVTPRKLTSSVTLDVRRVRKPGAGADARRIRIAIASVTTERPWPVDGLLDFYEGQASHVIGSALAVRAIAIVKIPGRAVRHGRHTIGACFTGSDALEASCAEPVKVRGSRAR